MTEIIAAWEENSLKPFEKLKVHELGLKHPAVSVFVIQGNKLLLQQRAQTKYHSPGLWANTVCTHPHWGENSKTCSIRRLSEELGINTLDLKFRGEIEYRAEVGNGLIEHEVVSVFVAVISKDLDLFVNPNPEEVLSVRWLEFSKLRAEIRLFPDRFTEWFKIYITQYSNEIFQKVF